MSITTTDYWDCECEHDYIHPSAEDTCKKCHASRDESPDSRIEEVQYNF